MFVGHSTVKEMDEKVNGNGWDDSAEELLRRYSDECSVRNRLHREGFYRSQRLFKVLKLPVIVLSALSGSLALLSKSYPAIESTIVTGTAGLSILVSIISAVDTFLAPGGMMSKHEAAKHSWVDLENLINHTLGLRRDLRDQAEEFLQIVKVRRDRLFEISPICSRDLIKRARKKIQKHATPEFNVPNYLNGFAGTRVWREERWEQNTA